MSEIILKIHNSKMIYGILFIQLIICFIVDIFLNTDLFTLSIIADIGIILGIILFYNNYLLICCMLIASFLLTYFIENIGFQNSIKYIQDYFILIMAAKLSLYLLKKQIKKMNLYYFMAAFLLFSIISFFINNQNIISYIKSLYLDYVRYFIIVMFIANVKIDEKHIKEIINYLWYALLLQVPLVIFQSVWSIKHWVPKEDGDIRQDFLCGIIGGRGTTELGLLLTIGLTAIFILYIRKKIKLIYFLFITVAFISIAVLAEIKFIIFLIPVCFIVVLLSNINLKAIICLIITTIILLIGISELGKLYPNFKDFLNVNTIEKYLNESYSSSGISRINSFTIAGNVISSSYSTSLVGYGAGTADRITEGYKFSGFNVSQYIVENGFIGVTIFYGMFIYTMYISYILMKKGKNEFEIILGKLGIILMMIIIVATFYNRSMVKINFSIFSWSFMGLVYRYYLKNINYIIRSINETKCTRCEHYSSSI